LKTLIPSTFHIKKRYNDSYDDYAEEVHEQEDEFDHKEHGHDETYLTHCQETEASGRHTTRISEQDLYELAYLRGELDE